MFFFRPHRSSFFFSFLFLFFTSKSDRRTGIRPRETVVRFTGGMNGGWTVTVVIGTALFFGTGRGSIVFVFVLVLVLGFVGVLRFRFGTGLRIGVVAFTLNTFGVQPTFFKVGVGMLTHLQLSFSGNQRDKKFPIACLRRVEKRKKKMVRPWKKDQRTVDTTQTETWWFWTKNHALGGTAPPREKILYIYFLVVAKGGFLCTIFFFVSYLVRISSTHLQKRIFHDPSSDQILSSLCGSGKVGVGGVGSKKGL